MQVRDIMTTDLITLKEDNDLDLARLEMSWAGIRHLPVVRDNRLVGLITHRDLLGSMCSVFAELDNTEQSELFRLVPVGEIMSREVKTVEPNLDASQAARILLESKYGCLPVVEEGNLLVGIVTEADFVQLAVRLLDEQAEHELDAGEGELPHGRIMSDNNDEEDW